MVILKINSKKFAPYCKKFVTSFHISRTKISSLSVCEAKVMENLKRETL